MLEPRTTSTRLRRTDPTCDSGPTRSEPSDHRFHAVNAGLADQDADWLVTFAKTVGWLHLNPVIGAHATVVSEGILAVHEHQGNMIAIMLQTGG